MLRRTTGVALILVGAAAVAYVLVEHGSRPAVLVSFLAALAGAWLIGDSFAPPAAPRAGPFERRRLERSWLIEAAIPITPDLAYAIRGQLEQAEASDALQVVMAPDHDVAYVSFKVIATDGEKAARRGAAALGRAELVPSELRARRP